MFLCLCLLAGCAQVPLGVPIDNPQLHQQLRGQIRVPDVNQVVFQTVVRWPGREVSLVEIVKEEPAGTLSVAGLSDIGNTVYTVRFNEAGDAEVLKNQLPLSNTWLVEGLVADLLVPWQHPFAFAELRRLDSGAWMLLQESETGQELFVFDEDRQWEQYGRLRGKRVLSQTVLYWDGETVPHKTTTENKRYHFRTVRERASFD
jgi:hypothetical protein